jgi:hypothetical protein
MSAHHVVIVAVALVAIAAVVTALVTWLRRPIPQHRASRSERRERLTIDPYETAPIPEGYAEDEDTGTWLARPYDTGAYAQLAPDALDRAAFTDAWVQASLAADMPLDDPPLVPLPVPTSIIKVDHVLQEDDLMVFRGRWVETSPRPVVDLTIVDILPADEPAPLALPAADAGWRDDGWHNLPPIVCEQLGGRTPAQYVDELFAGLVTS